MISPEKFLTLLEEKGLLSSRTVANLREQISQSAEPITAAALAKRLVKHGKLTPSQAKRMLGSDPQQPSPARPTSKPAAKPQPQPVDDLSFAPIEGEEADRPVQKRREKRDSSHRQPPAAPPRSPAAAPRRSLLDDDAPSHAAATVATLDGILSDSAMSGSVAGGPLTSAGGPRRSFWSLFAGKPKRAKKTEEEKWGGGLMLVGGGSLAVLVIASGLLIYAMNYTGAEKMLDAAHGEYQASSYTQAIGKYKAFLDKFPSHKQASLARVRIGLAKMRQATSGSSMSSALRVAEEEMETMTQETDFKEAHDELGAMLSNIAEGLAAEGMKKPTPAVAEQIRKTMALVESKVPKDKRPETKLGDVRAKLAIIDRELARGDTLEATIAAMEKTTKELKTADAYKACSALLHQYPDLVGDARLKKTLLAVSLAQQGLVKPVAAAKKPAAAEAESATLRSVTLAQCTTAAKVPDVEGQIVLAAVDGAVYGLDATTGRVLWRRMVGFDANPQAPSFPPTPLSPEPGSDVLALDSNNNEILRIEGANGRLRWRYPVGEPFDAQPVIAGDKILVATKTGKLVTIAAKSGESAGYVQFPQALGVAPAVDARRSLIYQVAAHTNLFILSLDEGVCKHVAYLGHEPASVTVAPVVVDEYLLVAVNAGAREATLKVFTIQPSRSDRPEPWLKLVQEIPLDGHLQMSPLVEGRRMLLATDSGIVRVFELSATDIKSPFREVAQTAIEEGEATNLTRFALMQNGQFWIADNRLRKYDVQAARGRLTAKWTDSPNSAYLQPPVTVGQKVVSVRRKLGMPGAIVSAVAMENAERAWDTQIASPLAGAPMPLSADGKNDGRVIAVNANGGVFKIDANQTGSVILSDPIAASDPFRIKQPVVHVVQLAGGLLAISDGQGGENVGIIDPASPAPMMRWPKLPEKAVLACSPISLGRGLLVPTKGGQVFWLDLETGAALAEPFQPRLEPGAEVNWTIPAIVNDKQALLCDGKTSIYLLEAQAQPKPHLEKLKDTTMAKAVAAPLAVLGQTAFVADAAGALTVLGLPSLAHANESPLGGRCIWGPARSGDNVFLATDDNRLLCFDAKGNKVWTASLEYGPLAGAPLRVGDHFLLASRSGLVWRAEAATGKELAKVDAGYPLATGPVLCGKKLLIGGHDGTLYEVRQP